MNTHIKHAAQAEAKLFQKKNAQNQLSNAIVNAAIADTDVTDASIDQYIITTADGRSIVEAEDGDGEQLLLYGDVDVLTEYKQSGDGLRLEKTQYIEDKNGIQHEITIEEQQDAIELLTFEDDQLE